MSTPSPANAIAAAESLVRRVAGVSPTAEDMAHAILTRMNHLARIAFDMDQAAGAVDAERLAAEAAGHEVQRLLGILGEFDDATARFLPRLHDQMLPRIAAIREYGLTILRHVADLTPDVDHVAGPEIGHEVPEGHDAREGLGP